MHALLSIKPEYAEKILKGEKLFEFRKVAFAQEVSKIFIYATSPVCRIVGEFEVGGIIKDSPKETFSSNISKEEIRPWQFKYSLINGMTSKLILMKNGIISSHHNLFVIGILLILPHPL